MKLTIEKITQAVCKVYEIELEDLRTASKKEIASDARSMAMYIASSHDADYIENIAAHFNRSRTSVYAARKSVARKIEIYFPTRVRYQEVMRELGVKG